MTVESSVRLADWCTLGVGGPARWFCHAHDESAVLDALHWADERSLPVQILGGGSNVVCADAGFDGLVLHVDLPGVTLTPEGDRIAVLAGAGEVWDPLVARLVRLRLAGLECLSGIPGQVGGTPIQNVGAYGQDVSETIVRVRAVDRREGRVVDLPHAACDFQYRSSRFKRDDRDRFVVTGVEFSLAPGPPRLAYADVCEYFDRAGVTAPSLEDVREAVLAIRRRKGMVIEPGNPARQSVGSFFINPVMTERRFVELAREAAAAMPHYRVSADAIKVPAAWLIEQAGFPKGTRRGGVAVSPLQAQAIVNLGGATAADVVALAVDIKRAVWTRFHVAIVPEPVFVGFRDEPAVAWLFDPEPDGDE